MSKLKLSEELKWRGFVNQTTISNISSLDTNKGTFYCGYDASSDSLTVGNLATVMFNKAFIRHGYKAIVLSGGATSLIGDPGGKDAERTLQDEQAIKNNVADVTSQLKTMLGKDTVFVNNTEWFKGMSVIEFLRDVGKHFSITPLIQRDYIAKRLGSDGSGISYAEFSYTLLQGYDFLHLHKKHGVDLQLAGSDQWGNCISGVELVRKVTGKEVNAITMPLVIDRSTGIKFGKSEAGAVWLNESKTSAIDFYQFWFNSSDDSVGSYLKVFTELDKNKIAEIMTEFDADKPSRLAQKALAYEVTKFVHGEAKAKTAMEHAHNLAKATNASIGTVSAGDDIAETLVKYGLSSSNTESRKLLSQGGVYINNNKVTHPNFKDDDFKDGKVVLRRGKVLKNTVVLKRR